MERLGISEGETPAENGNIGRHGLENGMEPNRQPVDEFIGAGVMNLCQKFMEPC
ncbi:MAG: hypothetical protein MI674_07150 [Cytophagales bacterium]|nr:hypothetical protein [Cytophagales bacterium]